MKKRLFALFLAAAMTLGMSMSVFAAEEPTPGNYSITVGQIANATTQHTYEAYQVFVGDLSKDGKLSNVTWGANVTGPVTFNGVEYKTAADLAKGLEGADAAAFAQAVTLTGAPVATATETAVGSGVVFSGLQAGYYIVKDQEGSLTGENDSYSQYMVQVVGNVNVTAKADVPSTTKKITDINDSTGTVEALQDSADYDIGDDIPFQFESTIVNNIANYKNAYVYTFHDKESAGLTFNKDSVKMTVDGKDYTAFTVNTNTADGCTFEIVTGDLKGVAKQGDKVVVTYTSKLNENAVVGAAGNPNEMYLEYSNNPNGEGTGKTPVDKVIAFTYKVVVEKVDEKQQPLAGAEFALQKKVGEEWVTLELVKNTEGTVFTFTGLDDGEYQIMETATPSGYNTISDKAIPFTVVAQHDKDSADPKLTSLTGEVKSGLVGTYVFAPDKEAGALTSKIVNQSGAILPSTGGIGTTIFYIIGIVLVCGAGAILFVRKRMGNEEV